MPVDPRVTVGFACAPRSPHRRPLRRAFSAAAWLVAAAVCAMLGACTPDACLRESDCAAGFTCTAGACTEDPVDAGRADAGTLDAGPRDASAADAGPRDAGPTDGATTEVDAGTDAGSDAGA